MSRFFNFWDPLERRYVFNSFLIVVALVELLIFVVTAIWQIDEGVLGGPVKVIPFPWKEYLFTAFTAPLVLLFLFGIIVRGFQAFGPEEGEGADQPHQGKPARRRYRFQFFLGLAAFLGLLILWFSGQQVLTLAAQFFKALGLGGAYLLVAVVALAALYFPLRLILNYRLQKKALEYQYLEYLAERHGVVLRDPKELAALEHLELDDQTSPAGEQRRLPSASPSRQDASN
jgi:magnesium-transporting ATPase (P-type)